MSNNAKKQIIYFFLYSIIGWLYEVFLEVVVYKWGFSNRGFLTGPYCVIYGFGALILIAALYRLKNKRIKIGKIYITPILVFLGIIIISTSLELIGSYVMEFATGSWAWDYTRFAFDFQGRIALNPSLRFGIGGMIFLYVFQPIFEKFTDSISDMLLNIISGLIIVVLAADCVYTLL